MVLGKRPDPLEQLALMPGGGQYSGANKPYSFHRQTDVGWDPQGNIFVSDGYGDSRVVKYDKNGRFIKSVGTRGNGPLQFSTPHAMAVDAKGHGLRRRSRQLAHPRARQRSEPEGRVRHGRRAVGRLHFATGRTSISTAPTRSRPGNNFDQAPMTGEVYKMELDGTVLGRFGKAGHAFKEFSSIHQMDCRNPDEVYVAEITAWRVQKIILHPQQTRSSSGK